LPLLKFQPSYVITVSDNNVEQVSSHLLTW